MLQIYNRNRRRVAILENAFDVREDLRLNALDSLSFSIPYDDPKIKHIQPFFYVQYGTGAMYRVMPETLERTDGGVLNVECEHVLATLMDNVLAGWHQIGNVGVYTDDVIRYILSKQIVTNWVLGTCDFKRQFEYGWEQENLLSALFSIPKPFNQEYAWRADTSVYPWRLSLVALDMVAPPELYVREGKNMISLARQTDPTRICTRLYAYGYGEGINQMGIAGVNGGVPYIQSPQEYIDRYGIVERVWVDRRYESAETLLGAAQTMLAALQEPYVRYDVAYHAISGDPSHVRPGERVRVADPTAGIDHTDIIVQIRYNHSEDTVESVTLANRTEDIAQTVADIADRQRIETTYAQGATQMYAQNIQDNADETTYGGLIVDFFIPEEMIYVNRITCKVRLSSFRSYSKATDKSGSVSSSTTEVTQTSSESGDANTGTTSIGQTSDSGGNAYTGTSQSGQTSMWGGQTETTSSEQLPSQNIEADDWGGQNAKNHNHGIQASSVTGMRIALTDANAQAILGSVGWTPSGAHIHLGHSHMVNTSHSHDIPGHSHTVNTSHSHNIPSHSHTVNTRHAHSIPGHRHTIDISHSHEVTPGIYRFSGATAFAVYVNGTHVGSYNATSAEIDLLDVLTAAGGSVPRGGWQTLEIRPNAKAHVSVSMYTQGFIQSRGEYAR